MPSPLLSWNGHEGLSGPFACRTEATMKTGPARADASGLGITGDRRGEHLPRALRRVGLGENRIDAPPYLSLEPAGFLARRAVQVLPVHPATVSTWRPANVT
jgi:hypothetical protein